MSTLINSVFKEFISILTPKSVPGLLTIPLTLFIVIIINNALGLCPYIFTASSHMTFTISLALPL